MKEINVEQREINVWTPDNVRSLRKRLGDSREQFAKRFRMSIEAVRVWEQGKGYPSGPVTVILDQLLAMADAANLQSV